jgi:hypothetical protein
MSANPQTINAATSNPAGTAISAWTPGSYAAFPSQGSPQACTAGIQTNGLNGTLHFFWSPDGVLVEQLPDGIIYNAGSNSYGAIANQTAGGYQVVAPAGQVFLVCTSYVSGSVVVSAQSGAGVGLNPIGPAGGSGPSGNVNITNTPLGVSLAQGTNTDRSGTLTTGGAAQQIAAANSSRKQFFFQNLSNATMWVNFGTAAVQGEPSIAVLPNYSLSFDGVVDTGLVSVIGATTGQAWTAKEW